MNVIDLLFIIIGIIILAVAFTLAGFVIRDKQLGKERETVLRYMSLTPKSKKLAKGYIDSRMVNDERTTYRERG